MNKLNLWQTGTALASTLAAIYLVCVVAFAFWPETVLDFVNAWVHGIDLNLLRPVGSKPLTARLFFYGLSGILVTGFMTGAFYALMYNFAGRCPGCRSGAGH
jgi:hypothetical protein